MSAVRAEQRPATFAPWPHEQGARVGGESLVRILAEDLSRVFAASAPEVDLVALGLAIADEGRRREEPGAPS